MIHQGKFCILNNRKLGADYFKMTIRAPLIARRARPGQFVQLRCQEGLKPLLRRPFSFHRLHEQHFEILYKVVGPGTKILANKHKGDIIDILGPLGNGFDLARTAGEVCPAQPGRSRQPRTTILMAGGMGVAALLALAERLKHSRAIHVLIGARTQGALVCAGEFRRLGAKVQIATDDGSLGHKGPVTELLKKFLLSTINYKQTTIYACGPRAMLQELARMTRRLGISVQGCLEEIMACGVGACLGCAVKTSSGYQRVCAEGPVFNLHEIEWESVHSNLCSLALHKLPSSLKGGSNALFN